MLLQIDQGICTVTAATINADIDPIVNGQRRLFAHGVYPEFIGFQRQMYLKFAVVCCIVATTNDLIIV